MTMLQAALDYAQRGWPVFPCSPENKQPLTPKDSAPGAKDGGLYAATTDEAQISAWWKRWPKAMIGVPTGAKIGAFVIDLDPREVSADDMLRGLQEWLGAGALPPCPVSRTQSGGLHLFFKMPAGKVGNRAGLFAKVADAPAAIKAHVDVRGDGGYVIVAPSVMNTGKTYAWEQEPDGDGFPPAPPKLIDAVLKRLDARPAPQGASLSQRASGDAQPAAGFAEDPVAKARHRYAMVALDREIGELASQPQGGRNAALNKASFALGGLVGAGILPETLARRELFAAAEKNGLVGDDGAEQVLKTIESGFGSGLRNPIDISQIGARVGTSPKRRSAAALRPPDAPPGEASSPAPSFDDQEGPASQWDYGPPEDVAGGPGALVLKACGSEIDMRCAGFALTDLGNAQRFVARFGADFRYVEQWGWLAWDGKRWNTHEADAILSRAVHDTVKAIAEEAHQLRLLQRLFADDINEMSEDTRQHINPVVAWKKDSPIYEADRLSGWCQASQSNAHISCIARLAQAYLTASPDDFDKEPTAINVANGTLRAGLVEGAGKVVLSPHRREDFITKLAPAIYDPEAACPVYDAFFDRVQPGAEMFQHLHCWGGVSMTAIMVPRMAFWYGRGRNGKGTLMDAWCHALGEYAQTIPVESFLDQGRARRGGEASPDIAALPNVRLLRTSEPEKNSKLAEGLIKLVTGGEPLRARHLNRDFFEFRPVFKLTMQGNYKPKIDGTDEGIWARMLLVPWMVFIPESERDETLPDKLKAEASGILNRLLDGLCLYLERGLIVPEGVKQATQAFREDSDPIGQFLADCVKREPEEADARVSGREAYALYVAWAKAAGEKPWGAKGFSRGLQDHGITRLKSSGIFYLGISLTKHPSEFEGQEIEVDDD